MDEQEQAEPVVKVKVEATVENLSTADRPQGSWQDTIISLTSSLSVAISLLTLIGLIVTVYIAKGQWDEMRAATKASADAANTAALALGENERQFQLTSDSSDQQFKKTLNQMREQTGANELAAKATKSAAETAAGQLELTQRPWIKIVDVVAHRTDPSIPVLTLGSADARRAQFSMVMHFKNVGHTVAFVTPYTELYFPHWETGGIESVLARERHTCELNRKRTDNPDRTLSFPDDAPAEWQATTGSSITPADITHAPREGAGVAIFVLMCANYQFEASPKTYQTRAVYWLTKKGDGMIFTDGESLSADQLFVNRVTMGDDAD